MKHVFLSLLTFAIFILLACNNDSKKQNASTQGDTAESPKNNASTETEPTVPGLFKQYEKLVSSLAADDDEATVYAAQGLVKTLYSMDTTSFNAEEKKVYKDISASIEENGVHIAANLGNIAHQREHLVLLSEDFYDLVKVFNIKIPIYKISCPKFNDGKGAFWLSATKEIKNPFYGAKMPACGSIEETISTN